MPWFRCFIRGEDFASRIAEAHGLVGFYTTRFIEAGDAAEAEAGVLARLRDESRLAPPPGYRPIESARVFFEEVAEVDSVTVPDLEPGFTWYPMEMDRQRPV